MLLTQSQHTLSFLVSHPKTETSHHILKTITCWSSVPDHIAYHHQEILLRASCILSDSLYQETPSFPHQAYPVVEHILKRHEESSFHTPLQFISFYHPVFLTRFSSFNMIPTPFLPSSDLFHQNLYFPSLPYNLVPLPLYLTFTVASLSRSLAS